MAGAALAGAVRREREGEPADERGPGSEPQRAQPQERKTARSDVAEQQERVPGADRPEQRLQRPERQAEGPTGEVEARLDLRLEAIGIVERVGAASELVSRQPELPERLQVVSRRRGPWERVQPLREELVVRLLERGPGGERPGGEVQRNYEPCKSRAAEMSSSKSGTSASS